MPKDVKARSKAMVVIQSSSTPRKNAPAKSTAPKSKPEPTQADEEEDEAEDEEEEDDGEDALAKLSKIERVTLQVKLLDLRGLDRS